MTAIATKSKTTITTPTDREITSSASRDGFLASGMQAGMDAAFAQLDSLLGAQRGTR